MKYIAIALALIATTANANTVVFFHSEHCGPCKQMEPLVWAVATETRVVWVDVEKSPQLARGYGVTRIPCFVAVYEGDKFNVEVGRLTGTCTLLQLRTLARFPIASQVGDFSRRAINALFFCPVGPTW